MDENERVSASRDAGTPGGGSLPQSPSGDGSLVRGSGGRIAATVSALSPGDEGKNDDGGDGAESMRRENESLRLRLAAAEQNARNLAASVGARDTAGSPEKRDAFLAAFFGE